MQKSWHHPISRNFFDFFLILDNDVANGVFFYFRIPNLNFLYHIVLKCQQVTQDLQQEDQKQPSKLITIKKTAVSSFGISLHVYLYNIYINFLLKLALCLSTIFINNLMVIVY